MILLTDEEMAEVQGDKDRCLAIIHGFDTCKGCSANCHSVAKAQLKKVVEDIVGELTSIAIDSNPSMYIKGVSKLLNKWQALLEEVK